MEDRRLERIAVALIITAVLTGTSLLTNLSVDPVADAGVDQIVDVGETVQFDGSSSKDAASYWWNFRDNGWSNETVNPARVYLIEGVYDVGLVVKAFNGKQSLDTVRITVRNDPPIADAGSNATSFEDEIITFNGSGSTDSAIDMPNLTYRWDFGDGINASGMVVHHSYARAGVYRTLLSVTDDQETIGRDTRAVTVFNRAPSVSMPNATVDEGTSVVVTAIGNDTPSDLNSLRYEWDNGKFGAKTVYTFNDNGIHHPQVTVRDDNDATASAMGNVQVRNVAPVTGILSASVKANITLRVAGEKWHDLQLYLYKDGSLVNILSVFKTPGNPNEQESTISNFTFDMTSDYRANVYYTPENDTINGQLQGDTPGWFILTFKDNSVAIQSHNFNVKQKDTWNWTFCPTALLVGHEITFESFIYDPGQDEVTTIWDFGDGATISYCSQSDKMPLYFMNSISHAFSSSGKYSIRMTATDDDGGIGTFQTIIEIDTYGVIIQNLAPSAFILDSSESGIEDSNVWYVASSKDERSFNITYEWHFGDGNSSQGEDVPLGNKASHSFVFSGNYITSVIVRDSMGAAGVAVRSMTIQNVAPRSKINCDVSNINEGIVFLNASYSTDTISDRSFLTRIWNFGDGEVAHGVSIMHVYDSPGNFNVSLTIIDNDGTVNASIEQIIAPLTSPKISLQGMRAYGNYPELTFYGNGDDVPADISNLTYYWDLGDGTNVAGQMISHAYAASGSYQIEVYVTDASGAFATARAFVIVVIDSDGDSLEDEDENARGTNPQEADSDGDDIIDYWEINSYGTDPTKFDTDDDQANDWYEITYLGCNVDTDHDGLNNTIDSDSDGDGIIDGLDKNPLIFDAPDNSTFPVSVTRTQIVNKWTYAVTVAMDYLGDPGQDCLPRIYGHGEKPPRLPIAGLGATFEIITNSEQSFIAFITINYPKEMTDSVETESLSLYRYNGEEWCLLDETGIMSGYKVWGKSSAFSPFQIGDSSLSDMDCDGLTDYYEQNRLGKRFYYSNPNNPDSDGDGLYDGWRDANGDMTYQVNEIKGEEGEEFTGAGGWGTRVDRTDSDADGLWDGWFDINRNHIWDIRDSPGEIGYVDPSKGGRSVGGFHTDYHRWDTDMDTVSDGQDSDPNIDLKLAVTISDIFRRDIIPSGYYWWKIEVSSVESATPNYDSGSSAFIDSNPMHLNWKSCSFNVPDDQRYIDITITLEDHIELNTDEYCDISQDLGGGGSHSDDVEKNDIEIRFDLFTGTWIGDDGLLEDIDRVLSLDRNGVGYVSGEEDGSYGVDENDCEMWFKIETNSVEVDGDTLACWEEANLYRLDPTFDDSDDNPPHNDADNDGLPNEWEDAHFLDPSNSYDAHLDFDEDCVPNLWEYQLGKDPVNSCDTIGFDFGVYLDWIPTAQEKEEIEAAMRQASNYLFEATDGYFLFKNVRVYEEDVEKSTEGYTNYYYLDTIISGGTDINAASHGIGWEETIKSDRLYPDKNYPQRYNYIHIPSVYQFEDVDYEIPSSFWTRVLIHEIGHYYFSLLEEYEYPDGTGEIPRIQQMDTIMTEKTDVTEFSTHRYYIDHSNDFVTNTNQSDYYYGKSCWEIIFDKYNYFGPGITSDSYRLPLRVQFDLDGDGLTDETYWDDYEAKITITYDSNGNPTFLYPVGENLEYHEYDSNTPVPDKY